MLNEIKDLCERERAVYRKMAPSEILKNKKFDKDCELVKKKQKVVSFNKEGEVEQIEVDFTFFDEKGWKYFIQPTSLKELEDFIVECDEYGFDVIIRYYDPETMEDFEEKFVSNNFGVDLLEEPFGVAILQDAFLMEDEDFEGGCDDPDCDCHKED